MHDFIAEAIEIAGPCRAGTKSTWYEREFERRAALLPARATSTLAGFQLGADDETDGYLVPINLGAEIALTNEANSCWDGIRGVYDSERRLAALEVARIEFARCTFFDLLCRFHTACVEKDSPRIERTRMLLAKTDWLNADHVATLPHSRAFAGEDVHVGGDTAGHFFRVWLRDSDPKGWGDRSKPVACREFEDHELLNAIALVWLDSAVAGSVTTVELFARATGARFHAAIALSGSRHGTTDAAESSGSRSSSFSQMGHNARHAKNRKFRATAISLFKNGNYRNKEDAAEHIAKKLDYAYSTVRNWLTNA